MQHRTTIPPHKRASTLRQKHRNSFRRRNYQAIFRPWPLCHRAEVRMCVDLITSDCASLRVACPRRDGWGWEPSSSCLTSPLQLYMTWMILFSAQGKRPWRIRWVMVSQDLCLCSPLFYEPVSDVTLGRRAHCYLVNRYRSEAQLSGALLSMRGIPRGRAIHGV